MKSSKIQSHERYKVEIFSQEQVARTLGIAADRPRMKVLEITRRELKTVPTATHAVIRSLDGKKLIVSVTDGWWACQLKAFKL